MHLHRLLFCKAYAVLCDFLRQSSLRIYLAKPLQRGGQWRLGVAWLFVPHVCQMQVGLGICCTCRNCLPYKNVFYGCITFWCAAQARMACGMYNIACPRSVNGRASVAET